MDLIDLAVAVFIGNILTLSMIWGLKQFTTYKRDSDAPWLVFIAVGFPLFFAIASFLTTEELPPFLDAAVVQQSQQTQD